MDVVVPDRYDIPDDIRQYHGKVLSRITPRIYSQNRGLWAEMNGTMEIFKLRPRTSNASGRLRQRKRTKEETVDNRIICSHFNKKKLLIARPVSIQTQKNSCSVNWTFLCIYKFFLLKIFSTHNRNS
jgi:hypothetical protein